MKRKNKILTEKEFKELDELIDKNGLDRIGIQIFWDKDTKNIGLFQVTEQGLTKILESQKLQKKPTWLKLQIETCYEAKMIYCTALRDEKKLSLPRHTRQLSRYKHPGDTNSATAYRQNGSKGAGQTGAKERQGKGTQNTTQARQQCAKT